MMKCIPGYYSFAAKALMLSLCCSTTLAASLNITLTDQDGAPVEDAVVYIESINGSMPSHSPQTVEVDQVGEAFVPHVRATTVGSLVTFPNSDHIRHHVYSFSEALTFEVPLYIGIPAEPTLFDTAGLVTLGCNIHDHMLGYILILETPFYSEINSGSGQLDNIPAGELVVKIWHPRLLDAQTLEQTMTANADSALELVMQLNLRAERMVRRAPKRNSKRY